MRYLLTFLALLLACCVTDGRGSVKLEYLKGKQPRDASGKPLASLYWPSALELCAKGSPWRDCFTQLYRAPNRDPSDLPRLKTAAQLLCNVDDTWEECWVRLEPADAPATDPTTKTEDGDKPAAARLWPFALELCIKGAWWEDCFRWLKADTKASKVAGLWDVHRAAKLLCDVDDTWEECFARLEPAAGAPPAPDPAPVQ